MKKLLSIILLCACAIGASAQPSFTNVTIGTANGGAGDGLYTAFSKINYALNSLSNNAATNSAIGKIDFAYGEALSNDDGDDTEEIQAALDAAGENGKVVLPPKTGNYIISATLKFQNGQIIEGWGGNGQFNTSDTNQVTIRMSGSDTNAIFEPYDTATDTINVQLKNLRLQGNGSTLVGVNLYRTSYSVIENCLITACDIGVLLDANVSNQCYFNEIRNCKIAYNETVNIRLQNGANANRFYNVWMGGTDRSVEFLSLSVNNEFHGPHFQGVSSAGDGTDIHVYADANLNSIFGGWIEACGTGIYETSIGGVSVFATTIGGNVTNIVTENTVAPEGIKLFRRPNSLATDNGFVGQLGSLHMTNFNTTGTDNFFFTLTPRNATNVVQFVWGYGASDTLTDHRSLFYSDGTNIGSYIDHRTGSFVGSKTGSKLTLYDGVIDRVSAGMLRITTNLAVVGSVTAAANAYDATLWDGSLKLATEDAVRDEIESLVLGGGGTTEFDDIADPSGNGAVALANTTHAWSSTLDSGIVLEITDTDADAAANTTLFQLSHNDGADANVIYALFQGDKDGTPTDDYTFTQSAFTSLLPIVGTTFDPGSASDTTISRASAGDIAVEGNRVFRVGGADVPVADGGTGASSLNNLIALTTHTTGNYALGDAEGGAATTGDSATDFFSSGTMNTARLGSGTADSTTFLRGDQTWATPSGSGDVVGPSASTNNNLVRFDGTTGKLIQDSDIVVDDSGNLETPGTISASQFIGTGTTSDSRVDVPDDDATAYAGFQANDTTTTSVNMIFPAAPFSGIAKWAVSDTTNWVPSQATPGTDYTTPSSAETFTSKGYDASGTGNTLKFIEYRDFVFPTAVDGSGTTMTTNNYSSFLSGKATSAGSGSTNANYAFFDIGTVPRDIDTGTELILKDLAIRVSGTDTDSATFTIGLWSPASSGAASPTDYTSLSTFISIASGTLTTPAAGDIFYINDTTLTGWALAVTGGRPFVIGIARLDSSNDDSITIMGGSIQYTRTK